MDYVRRERETTLKFGLFSVNSYASSYPETAVGIAQLAESAGFESLWAGEHVVLPDPQAPPSPMAPEDRAARRAHQRSEEHTSELQSHSDLVCRLLLEKKKKKANQHPNIRPKLSTTFKSSGICDSDNTQAAPSDHKRFIDIVNSCMCTRLLQYHNTSLC